jgi:hypothetical protein
MAMQDTTQTVATRLTVSRRAIERFSMSSSLVTGPPPV